MFGARRAIADIELLMRIFQSTAIHGSISATVAIHGRINHLTGCRFRTGRMSNSYYTDYPITEFGDEEGKKAPLRECSIRKYDGSKYCECVVYDNARDGMWSTWKEIKSGYIYTGKNRHRIKRAELNGYTV